jgi:negative regulator of flagellin synthesis FlgM
MIDPVHMGPVKPAGAEPAGGGAEVRRLTPRDLGKPVEAPSSATLPRLLDLVADLAHLGPPVDYARIAQVRRAIADGSYKIDADALAKAIVNFALKE